METSFLQLRTNNRRQDLESLTSGRRVTPPGSSTFLKSREFWTLVLFFSYFVQIQGSSTGGANFPRDIPVFYFKQKSCGMLVKMEFCGRQHPSASEPSHHGSGLVWATHARSCSLKALARLLAAVVPHQMFTQNFLNTNKRDLDPGK